jgi:hypothetical protein
VTPIEAGKLLGLMALYDNRKVGDPDIVAWMNVIGDLRYDDAAQSVTDYYRDTRERIMPADIRERVREIRSRRIDDAPLGDPPDECFEDTEKYRAWLRESRRAVADGRPPLRAVEPS